MTSLEVQTSLSESESIKFYEIFLYCFRKNQIIAQNHPEKKVIKTSPYYRPRTAIEPNNTKDEKSNIKYRQFKSDNLN